MMLMREKVLSLLSDLKASLKVEFKFMAIRVLRYPLDWYWLLCMILTQQ